MPEIAPAMPSYLNKFHYMPRMYCHFIIDVIYFPQMPLSA